VAGKIQEQLLEEFDGLFDGEAIGLDSPGSEQNGDLTQSLAETVTQLGQAAGALTVNPYAGATPSSANSDNLVPSGGPAGGSTDITQSLTQTFTDLGRMVSAASGAQPDAAAATPAGTNTRGGSSTATNTSGGGTSVESVATTFLESGFGIVPLITGLMGLFSGGSDAPPALEKYVMPSAISFDSADTGSGLTAADFDQTGAPRVYSSDAATPGAADSSGAGSAPGSQATGGGAAPPQITVNVQAMDAQSFMDYSSQIAQAVRGAMLNLSSLNDVVNEL
jgi:hypothetical protein